MTSKPRKLLRDHRPPPKIPRHYVEPRPDRVGNEPHCGNDRRDIIERYLRLMTYCFEKVALDEVLAAAKRMETQLDDADDGRG